MFNQQFFSFFKNVLLFLIGRLYKKWEHMFGKGRSYSEKASERGDLFAKQLIENMIHDRACKYDPYILDGNTAISYRTASVTLGKAHVTGLGSLRRTNICSLTEMGNRLFINLNLGAGPLMYEREIVLRVGNFQRKAVVLASLIGINVSVDFSVEKETGMNGFLLNFAINQLNGFKLSVNGYGYFDWAIDLFLTFWTMVLSAMIRNLLENELEQYILNRLPQYQFPVEGTLYRNKTKLNQNEEIQYNETSLSESFYMKESNRKPKCSRICPSSRRCDEYKWVEYGTENDLISDLTIMKTSRRSAETNKWTKEMNSFYLPSGSSDLFSGYLNKNPRNEVLNDKTEENGNLVSQLSRKTRELSKSLHMMTEQLDSVDDISSLSKQITSKTLKISDDFDHNNLDKLNTYETVSNFSESTNLITLSPAKGLENEKTFMFSEKLEKSKMEDFYQLPLISDRDKVEITSVFGNGNLEQSNKKLLEETFPEINKCHCKNVDENTFGMRIDSPTIDVTCDSSIPTQLEFSNIHKNILGSSRTEPGTFLNPTLKLDSERRKAQINYLEKMFNGKKTKRTEESNKNPHFSLESSNQCPSMKRYYSAQNLDGKLCSSERFPSESLICFSDDEFEKHL